MSQQKLCEICGANPDQQCRGTLTGQILPYRHNTEAFRSQGWPARNQEFYQQLRKMAGKPFEDLQVDEGPDEKQLSEAKSQSEWLEAYRESHENGETP